MTYVWVWIGDGGEGIPSRDNSKVLVEEKISKQNWFKKLDKRSVWRVGNQKAEYVKLDWLQYKV